MWKVLEKLDCGDYICSTIEWFKCFEQAENFPLYQKDNKLLKNTIR